MLDCALDLLEILTDLLDALALGREKRLRLRWRAFSRGKRICVVAALLIGFALPISALALSVPLIRLCALIAGLAALLWGGFTLFPIQPSRYTREIK